MFGYMGELLGTNFPRRIQEQMGKEIELEFEEWKRHKKERHSINVIENEEATQSDRTQKG